MKTSWDMAEKARRIREKYQLPFNQDAIAQTVHRAMLLTGRGRPKKAMDILLPLEKEFANQPFFDTTMAEIYKGLGVAMNSISPLKAKTYFKKARERYLSHLSPEDETVKQLEAVIEIISVGQTQLQRSEYPGYPKSIR